MPEPMSATLILAMMFDGNDIVYWKRYVVVYKEPDALFIW